MKYLFYIICCFSLVNCKCSNITTSSSSQQESVNQLEALLPENTFKTLQNTNTIAFYKIEQKLIKNTENEYTNKSVFIRNLNEKEVPVFLINITNNHAYNWQLYTEEVNNFSPSKQFILKHNNEQINLLIDSTNNLLSVINLEGQNIFPMNKKLISYFKNF